MRIRSYLATAIIVVCGISFVGGTATANAATTQTATTVSTVTHVGGAIIPEKAPTSSGLMGASIAATLPAVKDLRAWSPPVGDQGQTQSCVAWTMAYAMLGWYAKYQGHSGAPFSPNYMYSQLGNGQNVPTSPATGINMLYSQGNDTWANYSHNGTFQFNYFPTTAERANAAYHKVQGYHSVLGRGLSVKDALMNELAGNKPVAVGMHYRTSFQNVNSWNPYYDLSNTRIGGHEMLAVGYDTYGLIVQNSWGTGWGYQGFGRISWENINADVSSAYVIDGGFVSSNTNVDKTPPTVTAADTVVMANGIASTTSQVPVTVTWGASDASGVSGTELWFSTNGGTWVKQNVAAGQTSTSVYVAAGSRVNTAVRAGDTKGNWSQFVMKEFTTGVAQESTTAARYSTGWSRVNYDKFLNGSAYVTATAGAYVNLTFTGKSIAVLTTLAANRGKAKLWIDNVYKGIVDNYSATTYTRVAKIRANYSTSGTHTITLQAMGTAGRPNIDIDGVVVVK